MKMRILDYVYSQIYTKILLMYLNIFLAISVFNTESCEYNLLLIPISMTVHKE